jgi:hypothetical protein
MIFFIPSVSRHRSFRQRCVISAVAIAWLMSCGHSPTGPGTIAVPTLVAPQDDAIGSTQPTLIINNISTQGATYDFQVSLSSTSLSTGADLAAAAYGVAGGASGQTSFVPQVMLAMGKRYYWRARAVHGSSAGQWTTAFRFRTEGNPVRPPTIQSFTAGNQRAETGGELQAQVTVQGSNSSAANLQYEWTAPSGTFSGTGSTVTWHAPADAATPTSVSLTVTVIDRVTLTDADGQPDVREARVSSSLPVHLNNSSKEITDLANTFLDDFIHSDRPPAYCVRNFSDSCPGKMDELSDITHNRELFTIDSAASHFSMTSITYFTERNGTVTTPNLATWARLLASCHFVSTEKATGATDVVDGICELTNTLENFVWRLCDSHFLPPNSTTAVKFIL